MKTSKISNLLFVILFLMAGCQKGDTGPQGPQGEQGNANVFSETINVTTNLWSHFGTAGQPDEGYETDLVANVISSDILNTGAVIVYVSFDLGTQWSALPYTYPTGQGATNPYSESYTFSYQVDELIVDVQDNDFLTGAPQNSILIKVVAVAASAKVKNPNVNWKNYEEVKTTFHLKD